MNASVWQAYGVARADTHMIGSGQADDAPLVRRARAAGLAVSLATAADVLAGADPAGGNPGWANRQAEACFSILLPEAAAGWTAALHFLESTLLALVPGGIAVHVLSYDPTVLGEHSLTEHVGALTRSDVQRIALVLISRGHQLVQLRVGPAGPGQAGGQAGAAFGLIISRRL